MAYKNLNYVIRPFRKRVGCPKTLHFVITIITWKKWKSQKSDYFCHYFSFTNLWCSQLVFKSLVTVNKILKTTQKSCLKYLSYQFEKIAMKACWPLVTIHETKKMFLWCTKHCCLDNKEKILWPRLFVYCFLIWQMALKTNWNTNKTLRIIQKWV